MARAKLPTRPIIPEQGPEAPSPRDDFNRTKRKDFWNDPDRWDGISDTHATMIWEVRRPDRIDA